jgi:hypothetical protein
MPRLVTADTLPQDTPSAQTPQARRPGLKIPPLLVNGPTAARLCGVSARTWATLNTLGKTPPPIRLGGRVLWNRRELLRWVDAGCPDRAAWMVVKSAPGTPAGRPRQAGPRL